MLVPFKSRLKQGDLLIGPLLTIPSTEIADIVAGLGFDWVWVEMEHSPISLGQAQQMMQAVGGRCACLVRSPWNDSVWIKRILDLGCDGIIIPQIKSAAAAEQAVSACRYPPHGIRSVGIARAQQYGLNFQPYVDQSDEALTIVLQVEHIDGVAEIDSILDVGGFDAVLIGPYDLSASMGLIGQTTHPDVQGAIEKIKAACRAREIPLGIFAAEVDTAKQQISNGVRLIALSTDALFLGLAAKRALTMLKES